MKLLVRILAFILLLFCLQKAWAGIWIYRAEGAFSRGNFTRAQEFVNRLEAFDPANPYPLYLSGKNIWNAKDKIRDPKIFCETKKRLEKMTYLVPNYGRGWLYLGLNTLECEKASSDGLTAQAWNQIVAELKKAHAKEPASGWIAYTVGSSMLSQSSFLSAAEKQEAVSLIRRSLSIRYENQDSPYLTSALETLWNQFHDFHILMDIIPEDAFSYDRLIKFVEKKQLWKDYVALYAQFHDMRQKTYRGLCEKADNFLERGDHQAAYSNFQRAFWLDPYLMRARAGMLVSRNHSKKFTAKETEWLQTILGQEEQDVSSYLPFLKDIFDQREAEEEDSYLHALYFLRTKNFDEALLEFKKVPASQAFSHLRRFLAQTYMGVGDPEQAILELEPSLQDPIPDLRELYILKDVLPKMDAKRAIVEDKIKTAATSKLSDAAWWSIRKNHALNWLTPAVRLGLTLNLRPGNVVIRVNFQRPSSISPKLACVAVELWEGNAGFPQDPFCLESPSVTDKTFEFTTSGGKRWLDVHFLNPSSPDDSLEVLLGRVEVEYPL